MSDLFHLTVQVVLLLWYTLYFMIFFSQYTGIRSPIISSSEQLGHRGEFWMCYLVINKQENLTAWKVLRIRSGDSNLCKFSRKFQVFANSKLPNESSKSVDKSWYELRGSYRLLSSIRLAIWNVRKLPIEELFLVPRKQVDESAERVKKRNRKL